MIRNETEVVKKMAEIKALQKKMGFSLNDDDYIYLNTMEKFINWLMYDGPDPMDVYRESE